VGKIGPSDRATATCPYIRFLLVWKLIARLLNAQLSLNADETGPPQERLFYEFRFKDRIPKGHLLRRTYGFVHAALADLHDELAPF